MCAHQGWGLRCSGKDTPLALSFALLAAHHLPSPPAGRALLQPGAAHPVNPGVRPPPLPNHSASPPLLQVATEQTPGGAWSFVIFRAGIVQWWTDNIGQWQGQTSEAAASVLSRVYGIDFLNLTEGQVNGSTEFCKNAPCK